MPTPTFCPPAKLLLHRTNRLHHRPPRCSTPVPILRPSRSAIRFDTGAITSPSIQRYLSDDGPRYVMWYTARPSNWSSTPLAPPNTASGLLGLALSADGLVWQRVDGPCEHAAVLAPNEDWWTFDTVHLSLGSVAIDSNDVIRADAGVYFMYYAGGDKEKVDVGDMKVPGARMAIGVAISKDGEHFTRLEGDYPSGAVLQCGETEDDFDHLFVAGPFVLKPRSASTRSCRYIMYYFTYDERRSRFVIGSACSADGIKFAKRSKAPLLTGDGVPFAQRGVNRCCVVERGNRDFVMFVECVDDDGVHRIAVTQSTDCENWGALKIALGPGETGAWDEKGVSHPSAVAVDEGKVRLYYVGRGTDFDPNSGSGSGIGVAESVGEDWSKLKRIPVPEQTE